MKTIKLAIAAAALTSVTAIAVAQNAAPPAPQPNAPQANQADQNQPPRMNRRLARLDTNKDGVIDQQEFATAQQLKEADTNNDGTLSTDELAAMIMKRQAERQAERLTRRLDIDGDGKVTIAEIEGQKAKRFALMDRNSDGKLEGNELRRGRGDGDRQFGSHGRHGDGPRAERHDRRGDRHEHGKRWERQNDRDRGGDRDGGGDDFPMDL